MKTIGVRSTQQRRRIFVALVAVIVIAVLAVLAVVVLQRPRIQGTVPARVNLWAVTATTRESIVAVGGTNDARGRLTVVRTDDGGATWHVFNPEVPAMTRIDAAGDRLVGSITCLPQTSGGEPVGATPLSCLYASEDRGATWVDLNAGRLVDPSFVDAVYGWAHAQAPTGSTLFETVDGGVRWTPFVDPCPASAPTIYAAVATEPRAGYIVCFGHPRDDGQAWAFVELLSDGTLSVKYEGRMSGREPQEGLRDDAVQGFAMLPDGHGLLWATHGLYETRDRGSNWVAVEVHDIEGDSFWGGGVILSDSSAFLIRRGDSTSIVARDGDAWRNLISWPLRGGPPTMHNPLSAQPRATTTPAPL
jgi:hypothetical protein